MLSYRDAVVLLGGESALTTALDKLSSLALFALGAVDLFDARAEAVRLGDGLIRRLHDHAKGLTRYDRTERLTAAHAVVVVTAYFEALDERAALPGLTRDDQDRLIRAGRSSDWAGRLIDAELPCPAPQRPHEQLLAELADRYRRFSTDLLTLISGLKCWDDWHETHRDRFREVMSVEVPALACRRYEELFRRLAADFPEVAHWSNLIEHQATRHGLLGLQERLAAVSSGRSPSDRLAALVRANRSALGRPISLSSDAPLGMRVPTLAEGYVDPGFRLLPPGHDRSPADERTWADRPRRDDLIGLLVAHLTLTQSARAPLVILGQPGAGKSALTRILAARLPAADFLPLRVELRAVPADSDVLGQIEHAIKDALDESMPWPELVHAADGALPVVMLDGFDELLQATGVNQTDYLDRVAAFQLRQAERGRPLAVIVTSRTTVADRARLPAESVVLRLEPFDEDQVRRWVTTWNQHNTPYLAGRGLRPLSVEHVLALPQLSGQPLLLLMLALYDADANALHRLGAHLDEAELYERLLRDFAAREVRKSASDRTDADLARAVEHELLRLSVTAFAMHNRGRQWVTGDQLNADLEALLPGGRVAAEPTGFRRDLSPAENVIGGFFFVHRTQALREDQRLRTYEFLHATFGEYLVARLVVRELADLADELDRAAARNRPALPGDAFLHALLSFAVLSVRSSTMGFLRHGLAHRVPAGHRELLRDHLCRLFAESQRPRPVADLDRYQPVEADVPARHAAYAANLLLLAVLSADRPLSGAELFAVAEPEPANERWRRITRLWQSQLTRDEWASLTTFLRVRHFVREGVRHLAVAPDTGEDFRVTDLPFFSWPALPEGWWDPHPHQVFTHGHPMTPWIREAAFRDDSPVSHLLLGLMPYVAWTGEGFAELPNTPLADLLALLLEPVEEADPKVRIQLYDRAIRADVAGPRYLDLVLRQLEADEPRLPADGVLRVLQTWRRCHKTERTRINRLFRGLRGRPDMDHELYSRARALW
ncbi:NACHT domain-containing protein [Nonomuraea antri]|uniref:NACHT domain-containing protein n=1 Tax=Nonomuraea antri TaxID=2730852 RepID=UPI0038B31F00